MSLEHGKFSPPSQWSLISITYSYLITSDALKNALQTNAIASQDCKTKETAVIPFRVCSKLLIGTLKIYQQQVNNLFSK